MAVFAGSWCDSLSVALHGLLVFALQGFVGVGYGLHVCTPLLDYYAAVLFSTVRLFAGTCDCDYYVAVLFCVLLLLVGVSGALRFRRSRYWACCSSC